MKIPLSWLKDYINITLSPKELAHKLTMAGIETSGIDQIGSNWDPDKILIALVTNIEPHPNADRLRLATVNLGNQTQTVVCGAPNVASGQKIVFAQEGAHLFNTHSNKMEVLKSATIRGVQSAGMVCSELELGISDDHTGILVLPEDAPIGMPLTEYIGDFILDLEITPNRPDCLSVLGVAHEIAALTGQKVTEPSLEYPETNDLIESKCKIQVLDQQLCPRYTASLITDITVKPSPMWLQQRLIRVGMRPINNVVDVTNYVMLEYGQPLHSFDFDMLQDHSITVRTAKNDEPFTSLDGTNHVLKNPMLVISDAKRAVGLAGIMGGTNSEMTSKTTNVLLEAANFDSISIRRTTATLKMRTEASLRFDKGISPSLAPVALRRATQLILQISGGNAAKGIIDIRAEEKPHQSITLTTTKLQRVLGASISQTQIKKTLESLEFNIQRINKDALSVTPPYWRTDISIPEDLVEEVARIIGYDQLPMTAISGPIPENKPQVDLTLQERMRDVLVAVGLQETISYSLVSQDLLEYVDALKSGQQPLRMANPMSSAQEYLRTTLRSSILATLANNRRNTNQAIRIFEIGNAYIPKLNDLPKEHKSLVIILSGPRDKITWGNTDSPTLNFYDAESITKAVLSEIGIQFTLQPKQNDPILHPGRSASIQGQNDSFLGSIGEVRPDVLERFDLPKTPVVLVDMDLEMIINEMPFSNQPYQEISRFPGAQRDLALVMNSDIPAGRVLEIVRRNRMVNEVTVFDIYQGDGIAKNHKSLAINILFQASDHTLTSEEISKGLKQILKMLEREIGATLRS